MGEAPPHPPKEATIQAAPIIEYPNSGIRKAGQGGAIMLVCLRAWGMTYVSKSAVTIVAIALLCAGAALAGPAHVRTAGPVQAQPVATAPATGAVTVDHDRFSSA